MLSDQRFQRITIRREFDDMMKVWVDRDQFTQLLWNLFVNAADAMPQGGDITIALLPFTGGGEIDGACRITISDTGKGMSPQELAAIFEPFFSTKQEGTGLGLATVYRIVQGHGGRIRVESSPGEGTRFFIRLPGITGEE